MTSQTRDITETLIAQLQTLPPEQQQMVVNFVEFLAQKHAQSQPSQNRKKRRVAGLHEGMGGSIHFWNIYHLWENVKGNNPVRSLTMKQEK
ncbi:MAG: DUF2281 domain-containing protein, partial [Nostoc sp.]|uniref:DUF2281 domain-containing protein n=1 Tax=Nostoc sp. TaxID=1180 RepID=UPI002FFBD631